MNINQYGDFSEHEYNIDIILTSNDDFKDLKHVIKMYVYNLGGNDGSTEYRLKATKEKFTLVVEGTHYEYEDSISTYFFASVIHNYGEDQTVITKFEYDIKSISLKKIAKLIYKQFLISIRHYQPITFSPGKPEEIL